MNVMKIVYRGSRPFWDDPDLFADDCTFSLGMPSGHALIATVLGTGLACELAEYFDGDPFRKFLQYVVLIQISAVYFVTMGLSRLIVGAHTWT